MSDLITEAFEEFVKTLENNSNTISKRDLNVIQKDINDIIRKQFRNGYDPTRYMPKSMLMSLFKHVIEFGVEVNEAFKIALDEYNNEHPDDIKSFEWLQGKTGRKGAKHLNCYYIPEVTDKFFDTNKNYHEMEELHIIDRSDVKRSETPYKAAKRITKARTLYDALRSTQAQIQSQNKRITALETEIREIKVSLDRRIIDLITAILSNEPEQEKQITVISSVKDFMSLFELTKHIDKLSKKVKLHLARELYRNPDNMLTKREIALQCKISERSL